ncbi:MAG TPA: cysteine-rich CWC family protein [Caldimonas sp.]|nr:cysteine-rich CWC family protein [Caldimonas sp.]
MRTTPGAPPAPRTRCPLCGGPNGCAPAASGSFQSPCWCAGVRVPPALLARHPGGDAPSCWCASCIGRARAADGAADAGS